MHGQICQFCDEKLDWIQHNGTDIYTHIENGCEFITFSYQSNKDLDNLTAYLNPTEVQNESGIKPVPFMDTEVWHD